MKKKPKKKSAPRANGELRDTSKEPVSHVMWVDRKNLRENDYNPNRVAPAELELLIVSILEDGWTQPIVVLNDMTIVDGAHRYAVSDDKRLRERYAGFVPIVQIKADKVHRQMSTIRHNRARGVHGVLPMADIVKGMLDDGVSAGAIATRLGMEDEEIDRLSDRAGMPTRATKESKSFGRSFVPQDAPKKKRKRR